jgi:hypothetical protein
MDEDRRDDQDKRRGDGDGDDDVSFCFAAHFLFSSAGQIIVRAAFDPGPATSPVVKAAPCRQNRALSSKRLLVLKAAPCRQSGVNSTKRRRRLEKAQVGTPGPGAPKESAAGGR